MDEKMNTAILDEIRNYYQIIISIYESTGYGKKYQLNTFWAGDNMQNMKNIIKESQNAVEAVQSAQKTWLFSVNTDNPIKGKCIDWLLNEQRERGFDLFGKIPALRESEYSCPDNNVIRNGRILTPDFLRTVNIAHEIISTIVGLGRLNIIELGAGCGHLVRTLRISNPNTTHVIVDIPESLCFSYMFLRLNFPEAKTLYVTDANQLSESPEAYDFVFVPTIFKEALTPHRFDLFINTASLGEMTNDVIRDWMHFIQNRLNIRYLFTLNRFLNTVMTGGIHDWRLGENECSVLYDSKWKIHKWELEPSFTRCPYMDTIIARYVEIIAERDDTLSDTGKIEKSEKLLSEVIEEDWIRLIKSISPYMTYRDNILVHNMTMSGTLFKLWESIRLHTSERNLAIMLRYLETLLSQPQREFEETFYYESLLEKLSVNTKSSEIAELMDIVRQKREYRKTFKHSLPSYSSAASIAMQFPQLVEEGCHGYNIVKYLNKYHALSLSLGPINLAELKGTYLESLHSDNKYLVETSIDKLRKLIRRKTVVNGIRSIMQKSTIW